jgi:hypothetical protein
MSGLACPPAMASRPDNRHGVADSRRHKTHEIEDSLGAWPCRNLEEERSLIGKAVWVLLKIFRAFVLLSIEET